jgi:tetratricopeptide (TPR) repeat protein
MEFAIPQLRKLPYVEPERLAALGFSGAGFSQILLGMRHPDVMAVCDLESAIFDDRLMWPLSRGYGYDVTALRVPFLHTYSVPLSARESRISDFERMRYSTRYRYLVDAPGIHHWDFATEGFAASTVLQNRGEHGEKLRQAFETTNRYALAFFNAYVKGDAGELAFLRRSPEANGAPAGLATIRELPAVEPAPTADEFGALIAQKGTDEAMRVFDRARAADPEAALFREADLNRVGYGLLRGGNREAAVAVFRRLIALHPGSPNAHDSLAEALEAAGERAAALTATRRALELLSTSEPTARTKELAGVLQNRLKRLGG